MEDNRVMSPINFTDNISAHVVQYLNGNEVLLEYKKPAIEKQVVAKKQETAVTNSQFENTDWDISDSDDDSDTDSDIFEDSWEKTNIKLEKKLEDKISNSFIGNIHKYPGHENVKYRSHEISQKGNQFNLSTYWFSNGSKRLCPSNVQHNGNNNFCVNINLSNGQVFYVCLGAKECAGKPQQITKLADKFINKIIADINSKSAVQMAECQTNFSNNDCVITDAPNFKNTNSSTKKISKEKFQLIEHLELIETYLKETVDAKLEVKPYLSDGNQQFEVKFIKISGSQGKRKCPNGKIHPHPPANHPSFSVFIDQIDMNSLFYKCNSTCCEPFFIGFVKPPPLEESLKKFQDTYLNSVNLQFNMSEALDFASDLQKLGHPQEGLDLFSEYMNKHWAYVKGKFIELIKCEYDETGRLVKFRVKSRKDTKSHFEQFKKYNGDDINIIEEWLSNRNDYKEAKVWKPMQERNDEFNMFIEPNFVRYANLDVEYDLTKVEIINYHIKEVLCNGDGEVYDLFLKWFAYIVQNGCKRIYKALAVVICIIGEIQGTGKSLFVEWVGQFMFGDETYAYTQNVDDLTQQFNSLVSEKLFVYLNDIGTWDGSNKIWSQLKGRFGGGKQNVTRKFEETYTSANICNHIIDSNDRSAIKLEASNRRYWIIEVTKKMSGQYYKTLASNFNEENAIQWVKFLMTIDLSNYNPHRFEDATKETNLGRQMRQKQFHPVCSFLQEHVVEGNALDDYKFKNMYRIPPRECKTLYENLMSDYKLGERELCSKLEQYAGIRCGKSKSRYYEFPSKDTIKELMISKCVWVDID